MNDSFIADIKDQIRSRFELSEPIHFKPREIKKAEEVVRSKYEEGALNSSIDLERVRRKTWLILKDKNRELNELSDEETKYLAQIAYAGNKKKLIENGSFWSHSKDQLGNTKRSTILSQWLHVCLRYESDEIENSDGLRNLLQDKIRNYNGRSSRVKTWKENADLLFKNNAEESIGKKILERSLTIDEFLKSLRLSTELRDSQFSIRIIKQMVDIVADRFPRFIRQAIKNLKIKRPDGNIEKRSKELARYAASNILKAAGYDCTKKRKDLIRDELIQHLGDPRAGSNRSNWSGVDEESKKVFKQWLSQRDIEFFFEVVSETENKIAKNTHWRYRKKFWEAYLPYIENTWVVMGSRAEKMAKSLFTKQDINKLNYGKLRGANSRQSVFFMRIQGYDIGEYSHSGKTRIWKSNESRLDFRRKSIHVDKFRKHDNYNNPNAQNVSIKQFRHYNSHQYSWQSNIASWFNRKIGIEPIKSYRLNS